MLVEQEVPYPNELVAVVADLLLLVAMESLLHKQAALAELERILVPWCL